LAKLLIVDDDHLVRDLLQATLDFGAHEISQAGDGAEAIEAFTRTQADVVILDLDLPGLSGAEILRHLRQLGDPKVIVLTGSGPGREPLLRAAGAAGFLTKPFSPMELISAVDAALA
jgi:CheY-like chemotaxis protein